MRERIEKGVGHAPGTVIGGGGKKRFKVYKFHYFRISLLSHPIDLTIISAVN